MHLLKILILTPALLCAEPTIRGFAQDQVPVERALERKAIQIPQPKRAQSYLERMAAEPHHAGSPGSRAVAHYLLGLLRNWGLDARIEEFEALLPYPTERRVEMVSPSKYQARLAEPPLTEDRDSNDAGQLPSYNAYSASGDVTAPLVYVNYGIPEDYVTLKKLGIDVKGRIAIARYGKSWRGTKAKVAYENGAVGCLIYSDPRDDGYFQGDVYPKGPYRPADGVQRGSVMDMPLYTGDPLSPGWASEKGSRRLSRNEAKILMRIPVLPLSYADAKPLLENIGGPVAPEPWRGALPLTYHVGPGPATVHLKVDFDWSTRPVYNVIATIPGTTYPDQWVLYGNHHDAWVNGARDPVSGAAALLETARALAELGKQGWKPKRTIKLALWDAEEFGLIGSSEWVEKHLSELEKKAVVYINSDSSGKGSISADGSTTLEKFMTEVLRDLPDPGGKKTLLESALTRRKTSRAKRKPGGFHLGPLGAGSDYVAFIHHAGVASLNLGFSGDDPNGIYHSIYDSPAWFERFSDRDFLYSRALSQVTITALLRLADAPVLPFEFGSFARAVKRYVDEIRKAAGPQASRIDFQDTLVALKITASLSETHESNLNDFLNRLSDVPPQRLEKLNEAIYLSERALTRSAGLPGREWYKYEIAAPGVYTGYSAKTLPTVREAVEAGRWNDASEQARVVGETLATLNSRIQEAIRLLRER